MPPVVVAAVAAGAAIAGGIGGAIERSNASSDAKKLMQQRLDEYNRAGTPPETALPLVLQEFKQQGTITPELEKQINVEASKVAQIKEDPKLRNAAVQGLQLLQQRSVEGFGAEEVAALNKAKKETAKESQGRLKSILQTNQERGMSGSGAELAAQLSASQAGDQQLSEEADRIAASKAQASRDAIQKMFGAATQLRGQDFEVANTKAAAEDQLNRFKVGLEADRQARNIQSQNRAQEANLREQQRIADMNTQMANAEQQRQREAAMRDYQAKLALAQAKGGVYGDQASQRLREGDSAAQGWAQMGNGVSGAVTGIGAYGIRNPSPGQQSSPIEILKPSQPQETLDYADDYLGRPKKPLY